MQYGKPSIKSSPQKISLKEQHLFVYVAQLASDKTVMDLYLPAFTGNHPNFITFTIWCNLPGLPPFIIRSINNMEDISKFEVQSLTGKATVFSFVIIKKGSRVKRKSSQLLVIMMLLIVNKQDSENVYNLCNN